MAITKVSLILFVAHIKVMLVESQVLSYYLFIARIVLEAFTCKQSCESTFDRRLLFFRLTCLYDSLWNY